MYRDILHHTRWLERVEFGRRETHARLQPAEGRAASDQPRQA